LFVVPGALAGLLLLAAATPLPASLAARASPASTEAAAPRQDDDVHLGVNSCAGSTCHGMASTTKKKSAVVQNEYLIWQRYDKHAHAFDALQNAAGRRIAANLGIGPADHAPECLTCHADTVPAARRGVQFLLSDGVGCEMCHGGSEKWLGPHATGHVRHDVLVRQYGLFPTEDPTARAGLCLGCHMGDAAHPMTHVIMGAGHPRLAFELQTFTRIEPAHFVIDATYRARKTVAAGVQVWAVGQARALQTLAGNIARQQAREGAFPELVFFDCQACHHSTATLRWQRRASTGLGPGLPHLNDANAIMLRALPPGLAPAASSALANDLRALHAAMSLGGGQTAAIARRIEAQAASLAEALATHDFSAAEMAAIVQRLADGARDGEATDYAAAEQATMGFAAIIDSLEGSAAKPALRAALERCYAATQQPDHYDPRVFAAAAEAVAHAVSPAPP